MIHILGGSSLGKKTEQSHKIYNEMASALEGHDTRSHKQEIIKRRCLDMETDVRVYSKKELQLFFESAGFTEFESYIMDTALFLSEEK